MGFGPAGSSWSCQREGALVHPQQIGNHAATFPNYTRTRERPRPLAADAASVAHARPNRRPPIVRIVSSSAECCLRRFRCRGDDRLEYLLRLRRGDAAETIPVI